MRRIENRARTALVLRQKAEASIITACQQVRNELLKFKTKTYIFAVSLEERRADKAAWVLTDIDRLANRALRRISTRLSRISLSEHDGESITKTKLEAERDGPPIWSPTTWRGIHAEIATYIVHSIEMCRGALSAQGMIHDHVTRLVLVRVLEILEEMLWVMETNSPQGEVSPDEKESADNAAQNTTIACALYSASSEDSLEVVPGEVNVTGQADAVFAWFRPIGVDRDRWLRLEKEVYDRMISVHPERQPLFYGCTQIIEISHTALKNYSGGNRKLIQHPLTHS